MSQYLNIGTRVPASPAKANSDLAIAIGTDSNAAGPTSIALGHNSMAKDRNGIAIGTSCESKAGAAIVIGDHGVAGDAAVALGGRAMANHGYSVALGFGSATDKHDSVSVGSAQRRRAICNVADGEVSSSSHEAVTGRQLYETNERVDQLRKQVTGGGVTSEQLARTDQRLEKLRRKLEDALEIELDLS